MVMPKIWVQVKFCGREGAKATAHRLLQDFGKLQIHGDGYVAPIEVCVSEFERHHGVVVCQVQCKGRMFFADGGAAGPIEVKFQLRVQWSGGYQDIPSTAWQLFDPIFS